MRLDIFELHCYCTVFLLQVIVLSIIHFLLFAGNTITTLMVIRQKVKKDGLNLTFLQNKYRFTSHLKSNWTSLTRNPVHWVFLFVPASCCVQPGPLYPHCSVSQLMYVVAWKWSRHIELIISLEVSNNVISQSLVWLIMRYHLDQCYRIYILIT